MEIRFLLFFKIFLFYSISAIAQSYSGATGSIPDNGTMQYFNLNVSGLSPSTIDGNFGLEGICLDITHPETNDLIIVLVSPDGTEIELSSMNSGANYTGTCFNNTASVNISNGNTPYSGAYKPEGFLGSFNNGQNGNGTWKLGIKDWKAFSNSGTLNSCNITFGNNPAQPLVFTSSNLPIIVIGTDGNTITDEPKVLVDMGIIYNGSGAINYLTDPFNHYDDHATIEYRGSSSQEFAKKSYSFETCTNTGIERKVSLLGMPAETDWILYAPFLDKSLVRNVLTYKVSNLMEDYASRTQYVELVIDGHYQGVYVLMEKIKRGKNRVNISKLTKLDNSGDDLTGGYIIKIDKTTGAGTDGFYSKINSSGTTNKIYFQYHYPKYDSITSEQKSYIESYVDSFETALMASDFADPETGYRKFIDVNTFIDFFLITEFSKNVDGYRLSTYLYKDKYSKRGKLKIGPIWDYDLAWHNANFDNAFDPAGWRYLAADTDFPTPQWWKRFMQDPEFINSLKCRWQELKQNQLSVSNLKGLIAADATYLSDAQERNFTRWPVIGTNIQYNPSPYPTTYQGEIDVLNDWIDDRYAWMNTNMSGTCTTTGLDPIAGNEIMTKVFPNPFNKTTRILFYLNTGAKTSLKIYDILGKEVATPIDEFKLQGTYEIGFDGTTLSPGIYYYKLISGEASVSGKMILQN